jgi:hypothetical protein
MSASSFPGKRCPATNVARRAPSNVHRRRSIWPNSTRCRRYSPSLDTLHGPLDARLPRANLINRGRNFIHRTLLIHNDIG